VECDTEGEGTVTVEVDSAGLNAYLAAAPRKAMLNFSLQDSQHALKIVPDSRDSLFLLAPRV